MKHDIHLLHLTTPQFLVAIGLATWMTWFLVFLMASNMYKVKK